MKKTGSLWSIQGIRLTAILLSACSIVQAAATIVQAWSLATAVTVLFQGGEKASASLLSFLVAYSIRHLANWLTKRIAGGFAERTSEGLQANLMNKLMGLGPRYAAQTGSGKLVTMTIDGIVRFRNYLERFVPRMLDMAIVTLIILVYIYTIDPLSGIILTVTMPVLIVFFILLGSAARKTADKQWRSYQTLARHFTDTMRGLETLRFLGRSRSFGTTVKHVSDRYRRATMRTLRVAFLSSFALDFFSTLSVAFVAVGLGLRLIEGQIDLLPALTVLLLAPDYFQPVRMLGSDYHASVDGKEAWNSIRTILDESGTTVALMSNEPPSAGFVSNAIHATIELDGLTISGDHPKNSDDRNDNSVQTRLSQVSATLDGEKRKIGIVGASGAGKSTLLHSLSGFISPDSGAIRIDGVALDETNLVDWQRITAYIPQHPYLFSDTLYNNVRFYEPSASEEDVLQALDMVGLSGLVHELPQGIHTRIGEGGRKTSGGQAQRIALARALVGNRKVLLLDEPTAHLDLETEWELKQTMLSLFGELRVFLATHRIHWMKEMDWILVLDNGRLCEQGTHEQLLAQKGVYYSLVAAASHGGVTAG